jgi:hypothetical protein
MVISTFEEATEGHGRPERVMTDKGSAFWSWKGISRFTALLTEMGIDSVVAEHKEWNGKVEVFNANLHKELFDAYRFHDVAEMRRRRRPSLVQSRATHPPSAGSRARGPLRRAAEVLARIEAGQDAARRRHRASRAAGAVQGDQSRRRAGGVAARSEAARPPT